MTYRSRLPLRSNCRTSFTLIEMLVVVGIVAIILTLALPAISTMWNQAQVTNAHQLISNILQTAAQRSRMIQYPGYGVFFYVDKWDHQVACFIKWRGYPDKVIKGEHWPDVADRFMIDTESGEYLFNLKNYVRVAPLELLKWTDEQILNDDYRVGNHRNTFVVTFQEGIRYPLFTWIEDVDEDDDGIGDLTHLPVADVEQSQCIVEDMLVNADDELLEFDGKWGVLIYDESLYQEQSTAHRPQFVKTQYARALLMDRLGRTAREK